MRSALSVEWLKLRRSPVALVTTGLVALLMPALAVAFLAVARQGGSGAAALKAQAMVQGDGWEAYLSLAGQMLAVGMFVGPGVVAAWVFGREFADRTFTSLFALPVSRRAVAAAKLTVLACWGLGLALLTTALTGVLGVVARVGSTAPADVGGGLARLATVSFLSALVATVVGYVASVGRGYLPGIGALILLVVSAQVAVLFGTGGWFPVATPGLLAVAGTAGIPPLTLPQLLLVPATVAVVGWLTVRWWGRAEVT